MSDHSIQAGDDRALPLTTPDRTASYPADPLLATTPPAGPLAPTDQLAVAPAGYVILRELGRGGMGVVYEARQVGLNRSVALKVIHGRGEAAEVVRFLTEAEAVAAVRHPHVVQVYEFGQHSDGPFLVLELLTGGTLADRLRSGRLTPRAAAELVAKLAAAVRAVHDLGIVHRDLKPGNILFDEHGEPRVTDFGLAKRGAGADLTHTGAVMGTPAYMAPEQARGEAKFVGPAADVWALGAILYECLTGRRPFEADSTLGILRKVAEDAPPPPRILAPAVPRDLERVVLTCLEKDPADRYPSAAALAADLDSFLAGRPVRVRPAGPTTRFVKWCRRSPVVAGFSAALLAVGLLGLAGVTWALTRAEERGSQLALANAQLGGALSDLAGAKEAAEARGYLTEVALAHQLWRANDLPAMRAALDRCPPERREWEWYYLRGLSRPFLAEYPADGLPLGLAYSPDGRLLAQLDQAGTLVVHDLAAGTERLRHRARPVPAGGIRTGALAFRPDGRELAFAAGPDLWVLDLAAGTKQKVGPDRRHYAALGYAGDGRLLGARVTFGIGRAAITIEDARAGKTVATLKGWEIPNGLSTEAAGLAFSPDGSRFAAVGVDSGLRIGAVGAEEKPAAFRPVVMVWDTASGAMLTEAEAGASLLGSVAFSPDGRAVGFGRGVLVAELEVAAGSRPRLTPGHAGGVLAVTFGPDGLVWSGGEDRLIRAHDRKTGAERLSLRGCPNGVLRLAVSPGGAELAVAVGDLTGRSRGVYRFDLASLGAAVWRAPGGPNKVSVVAALATDGARSALVEFDLGNPAANRLLIRNGRAEHRITGKSVGGPAAFRPDGGLVALGRDDKLMLIGPHGEPGGVLELPFRLWAGVVPGIVCTPDGRTVAAVVDDNVWRRAGQAAGQRRSPVRARLLTWDGQTRQPGLNAEVDLSAEIPPELEQVLVHSVGLAVAPDGSRVAAAVTVTGQPAGATQPESRGVLLVWDLATGRELFRRATDEPLRAVAFDPLGRPVAAGGTPSGGVVLGWDPATGAEVLALRGHARPVLALAFGPGGRLATAGADRVVKLWDTASRRELVTLDGFAAEVTHVAFTRDGQAVVAGSGLDWVTAGMAFGVPQAAAAEVRTFRAAR